MANKISACVISKNEEEHIMRCLSSIVGVVDEIILVDTGSIDHTVDIAKEFGAKIIIKSWEDDFSLQRNTGLSYATGDWIFFIDCDEELDEASRCRIKEVIKDSEYEAYSIIVKNILPNDNSFEFISIRLFKNRECFRFRGKIHEQIVYSITENYGNNSISYCDLRINHYGYNPFNTNVKAKLNRNLRILHSYVEDEKDGFYYFNLGTEYLKLDDKNKSLDCFEKALEKSSPNQGFSSMLVKRTITTLMDLKRYKDAITQLHYYQSIYPNFKDLYFLEVLCNVNSGYYSKASNCLKKYMEMGKCPPYYPSEELIYAKQLQDLSKNIDNKCFHNSKVDLSVCIITKNDEENIGRCILSVNEIADEVVVIDLGSSDRTCTIAQQLFATVVKYEWDDNLSNIRNFSIRKVMGKWILFIDGDEMLSENSLGLITDTLEKSESDGYLIKIITFQGKGVSINECYGKGAIRLLKNNNYYYIGEALEQVENSIKNSKGKISKSDIEIFHFHNACKIEHLQEKSCTKLKSIQNNNDYDEFYRKNLMAVEYLLNEEYEEVINNLSYCINNNQITSEGMFCYTKSLINMGRYTEAYKFAKQAVEEFLDYTDLFYFMGICEFSIGKYCSSIDYFEKCLCMGEAPWDKYIISMGSGSYKALKCLAMVYWNLGEADKALKQFLKLTSTPLGLKDGIEGITQYFNLKKSADKIPEFLKEHNIYNLNTRMEVIKTLIKMKNYPLAHEYFHMDMDSDFKEVEKNIENFDLLINAILIDFNISLY